MRDLAGVPGKNDAVVAAITNSYPGNPYDYAFVYSQGKRLPNGVAGVSFMDIAGPDVLWGYNSSTSEFGLKQMTIDDQGALPTGSIDNLVQGFGFDIRYADGKIFSGTGTIVDTATKTVVGTLPMGLIVPDATLGKVFVLSLDKATNGVKVQVFDMATLGLLGTIPVPEAKTKLGSLVRWGVRGLSFRADDKIWLVESDLVAPRSIGLPVGSMRQF